MPDLVLIEGDIIVWTSEIIKRSDNRNEDDFENLSHILCSQ